MLGNILRINQMKPFHSATVRSGGNAKTIKGDKAGEFVTAIMYLAPARMAGGANLCSMATLAGCDPNHGGGCLVKAGRASYTPNINLARIAKTQRYLASREAFMAELVRDIGRFARKAAKHGLKPAVRLNGTSDILWETAHPCYRDGQRFASIFEAFPEVQFYDYTKVYKRVSKALPANYSLTLSYSEASRAYADAVKMAATWSKVNVAVVFRTKAIRDSYMAAADGFEGVEVIDGDETDMRFLDPKGATHVVGLYAKGNDAKRDSSGFVID
ncbi:hypothetical protein NKI59_11900 [Mesorhizobium sp. M0598]|uniref:GP88 family protein n=1 Tax=Mesorhizobium sp. M0598 TaxID=2956968 RepID=UPI00333E0A3F